MKNLPRPIASRSLCPLGGRLSLGNLAAGFTLIELLVVIAIIAVLVGVALPYVQNYVNESRISKAKADLEEITRALMVYETREKTYVQADISQLVGRFLNRAPSDPWGRGYVVSTGTGDVYSCGPDRLPLTPDDIVMTYLPPLTLVNVQWVDANHTGSVDTQNVQDFLKLDFSRILGTSSRLLAIPPTAAYQDFHLTSTSTIEDAFEWSTATALPGSRTVILKLAPGLTGVFMPGSDTLAVKAGAFLYDQAGNRCIASQDVVIKTQ